MQHKNLKLITRSVLTAKTIKYIKEAPVVVLLGARQVGKTTLALMVSDIFKNKKNGEVHHFDLERASSRAALKTPEITLESLQGLVIIDEIQRIPQLFETLRPLADSKQTSSKFLVLGSASPQLVRGVSESLAGRALFIPVNGFSIDEAGITEQNNLWIRGGFPRSFLASSQAGSKRWRESFISTFLERDIPQLGIRIPSETLRRFWTMLAHYHGQSWNSSELGRSIGVSSKTASYYRDILAGGYMLRVLPPWFENLKKRQVKSPKVYIRDSGLLHSLLQISDIASLRSHPGYGASWEGFALEQVLIIFGSDNAYYWKTQRDAELDLLLFRKGKRIGFEFKCTDAPKITKSMHIALQDLSLNKLYVVYPGKESYKLHKKIDAFPLIKLPTLLK